MTHRAVTELALSLCLAAPLGCAVLERSEPFELRYFSPERPPTTAAGSSRADGTKIELRLGEVRSASHLDLKLVYRTSHHEIAFSAHDRWSERPEEYLRRALSRAFYERFGVVRAVSGRAPTLEVLLVAFEEIRMEPRRARFEATIVLHDERAARLNQTFVVEVPIDSRAGVDGLVSGLALALDRAVSLITAAVIRELEAAREADLAGAAGTPPGQQY